MHQSYGVALHKFFKEFSIVFPKNTLFDSSLHNINNILNIMNSIKANSTKKQKIMVYSFFQIHLVTHSENCFSTYVYYKRFAISLLPHVCSSRLSCQKMDAFCIFINRAIYHFSDSQSLNSEIRCVKTIAIDRSYTPYLIYTFLFKLRNPFSSSSLQSPSPLNNSIVKPFFPKSCFSISKILR